MLYLYWVLVFVMVVGIIGAIVPGIPGISLIAIAAFIWAFATNFTSGTTALIVAVVVLILGIGIDFWQATSAQSRQVRVNGGKLGQ